MARPLRIEFEGALYHVMARGNAQGDMFLDDADRHAFIENLGRVCQRLDRRVWAWCQMSNHYHLLIETLSPTLSQGMREVNGVYTQDFNRCHGRVGHVLQGRCKAVLVQKETYLLELSRYVVLNPVQAGIVETAGDWPWSSYRGVMGKAAAPDWLAVNPMLELFHAERGPARRAFARFVADGVNADDPYTELRKSTSCRARPGAARRRSRGIGQRRQKQGYRGCSVDAASAEWGEMRPTAGGRLFGGKLTVDVDS